MDFNEAMKEVTKDDMYKELNKLYLRCKTREAYAEGVQEIVNRVKLVDREVFAKVFVPFAMALWDETIKEGGSNECPDLEE